MNGLYPNILWGGTIRTCKNHKGMLATNVVVQFAAEVALVHGMCDECADHTDYSHDPNATVVPVLPCPWYPNDCGHMMCSGRLSEGCFSVDTYDGDMEYADGDAENGPVPC